MTKSPEAYRTISEVAGEVGVPAHVLRFWENKFPKVKPMKRGGNRRYYTRADVDLLIKIKTLLYDERYTIEGVQKILSKKSGQSDEAEQIAADTGTDRTGAPDNAGLVKAAELLALAEQGIDSLSQRIARL